MNRPRHPTRADVAGFVLLLAVIGAAVGLTVIAFRAPLVLVSIVGVVCLVAAGHLIGDEAERLLRRLAGKDPEPVDLEGDGCPCLMTLGLLYRHNTAVCRCGHPMMAHDNMGCAGSLHYVPEGTTDA